MQQALGELERELQMLDLWSAREASAVELASDQPFCVDTMAFEQWLQWVFLPRMQALAERDLPMPGVCQISPMAEQSLQHLGRRQGSLLTILSRIDRLSAELV
jgi:uncharacterized protein YqcC (DUF446 family)